MNAPEGSSVAERRRIAVVTNPAAGVDRGTSVAALACARLAERGAEVVDLTGVTADDSVQRVRSAVEDPESPPDAVVCIGGDGLMHALLGALAQSQVPLGLVPAGTGNDLAREFGIPLDSPEQAADIVLAGHTRVMDLGRLEAAAGPARWFATVVATGFDARVTRRANALRYPRGPLRYTVAAVVELLHSPAQRFRVELHDLEPGAADNADYAASATGETGGNGGTCVVDAVLVPVGNTRTYGGGMQVCPDARTDDGYLDIAVVGARSRLALARYLPALSAGKRVDDPDTRRYRARRVVIDSPGGFATVDGEAAGELPVTVEVVPDALTVLAP